MAKQDSKSGVGMVEYMGKDIFLGKIAGMPATDRVEALQRVIENSLKDLSQYKDLLRIAITEKINCCPRPRSKSKTSKANFEINS